MDLFKTTVVLAIVGRIYGVREMRRLMRAWFPAKKVNRVRMLTDAEEEEAKALESRRASMTWERRLWAIKCERAKRIELRVRYSFLGIGRVNG